jgi:hypothetical protein
MSKDRMSVTFEGRNMQELVEKIFGFLNVLKLSTGGENNDKASESAGDRGEVPVQREDSAAVHEKDGSHGKTASGH